MLFCKSSTATKTAAEKITCTHVFFKKKILADVHVPLLKYHITYRWWTFHDYLCVFLCCSLHLFSVIVRVRWWHVGPTMSCRALDSTSPHCLRRRRDKGRRGRARPPSLGLSPAVPILFLTTQCPLCPPSPPPGTL